MSNSSAPPGPGVDQPSSKPVPAAAIMVAGAAALGGFLFGYDTAIINGTVGALESTFDLGGFSLGFVVSSALLGCAVGAWFAGPIANRWGRTRVMMVAAALFFFSSLGSALAFAPWDLTLWRMIGGLGVGAASVIAPAYIAEISPASWRGRLGSLQQLAIVTGIFVALLVGYLFAEISGGAAADTPWGGAAWRWMFASEMIPAAVYFIIALRIPESPRYLVSEKNFRSARAVLKRLVGGDVNQKVEDIKISLRSERAPRISDIRAPRFGLLPIVWVGMLLAVFQQFVGINVIFYYSSVLWQAVGFTESDSLLITVITSVTNIVTTIVAIMLVDKVGRRPLLLVGSVAMTVSLAVMAFLFATAPRVMDDETGEMAPQLGDVAGPVALIAANVFVFGFGCSWGPVVWILLGEMFGNRIRASAMAIAVGVHWLANWSVTMTFPVLSDINLGLAYGIYASFALISLWFVWRFVIETKGQELEDMDELQKRAVKNPAP